MKFKKYSEIENATREKAIDDIVVQGHSEGLWFCENKIDGANFSVWYDGETMKFAKRSGFIGENENFFNYQKLIPKFKEWIEGKFSGEIVIYGELFGGYYRHPDVKNTSKGIQKRVSYSPDVEFIAFDIKQNGQYLSCEEKYKVFAVIGIPYCEPVFSGTFAECLEVSPVFEDETYKRFGLPKVENNFSEGLVLKPNIAKFFPCGSRVILKNKNEAFADKSSKKSGKQQIEAKQISDAAKEELQKLFSYVTENRLKDVVSHVGEVTHKDFGKLMKEFNQDILADYTKDSGDFSNLEKEEQKIITKSLNKETSSFIRERFLNIIDGRF